MALQMYGILAEERRRPARVCAPAPAYRGALAAACLVSSCIQGCGESQTGGSLVGGLQAPSSGSSPGPVLAPDLPNQSVPTPAASAPGEVGVPAEGVGRSASSASIVDPGPTAPSVDSGIETEGQTGARPVNVDGSVGASPPDPALPANAVPVAALSFVRSAEERLTVTFDGSASHDPDGTIEEYHWDFGDGMTAVGSRVTHSFTSGGCFDVGLSVTDDRGDQAEAVERVAVAEQEPDGAATADLEPLPQDYALLPRDPGASTALFHASGKKVNSAWVEAELLVKGAGEPERTVVQICEGSFSVSAPIAVAPVNHTVTLSLLGGTRRSALRQVENIVAGDVLLIQGQSNAVSGRWSAAPVVEENTNFVRSFGNHVRNQEGFESEPIWRVAFGELGFGPAAIGRWPLRMASNLVEEHSVPFAVINHARGGKKIDFYQRNEEMPRDPSSNYGQALHRLDAANLLTSVRAVLYIQGEDDGDNAAGHRAGFETLHAAWREDFPRLERVYVGQVRGGCGNPSLQLREVQRSFARTLPITTVMSTNGLNGHDGCHFRYDEGYRELGDWFSQLLSRDLFGVVKPDTEAVDVVRATLSGSLVRIETQSDASELLVDADAREDFAFNPGNQKTVSSIVVKGSVLELTLQGPGADPTEVRYASHRGPGPWITNARGVGLLSFILPIEVQ